METRHDTVELAARIVAAYVARNNVPATRLPALIADLHAAIAVLGRPEPARPARPTPAQIAASIRPHHLVSFEDGKTYKTLRRHLTLRGLTAEAYRAKWGLPVDYPLVSAAYSARRSTISRAISSGMRMRMQAAAE
ncbi:MucR family transcriptional regulator [Methylobacterium trifolii]